MPFTQTEKKEMISKQNDENKNNQTLTGSNHELKYLVS
jgi:hypothetical protein